MTSRLFEGKKSLPAYLPDGTKVLPENTIRAFIESLRQGANGVEFDVYLSADEVPMVIHDSELALHTNQGRRLGWSKSTKSLGKVGKKTWKELRNLKDFDL